MKNLRITVMHDKKNFAKITLCRDVENDKFYLSNSTNVTNASLIEINRTIYSEFWLCDNLEIYANSQKPL